MLLTSCLFRFGVVFIFVLLAGPLFACDADRIDASATVEWIADGDTVKLQDGRNVRLIGINTPELNHEGKPSQPYAKMARAELRKILATSDNRLSLRYGEEKKDRHNRLLAHLYLPDGRNVNALMVRRGLAVAIVIPPNDWNLDCYRQAEAQAHAQGSGIWSLPAYRKKDSRRLRGSERGYRFVEGLIERVGKSRHSIWLNLRGRLAIRIDRKDIHRFSHGDFSGLEGRQLIARGWIYQQKGELRMRIRHPADLELLL
ncbi:MAG: thermonuclease family protein [Pseudomonadota bacterium]